MIAAPPHPQELARKAALDSYQVLDTPRDPAIDELTEMAARLCRTSMAKVSLVDGDRQWFKSSYGFDVSETPREQAFCGHAILGSQVFVVPDALKDERFADNPLCITGPRTRFYAGVPLVGTEGLPLGALCVLDREPRPLGLDQDDRQNLTTLAGQVMRLLELHRALNRERIVLSESVHRTKNILSVASAIADRTLAAEVGTEAVRRKLAQRFAALGRAQQYLMKETGGGSPIEGILRRQVEGFLDMRDGRVQLSGGPVLVRPEAAEALGLAFHELTTNALKYGALSVPSGQVAISWERAADGSVDLVWRETGGPAPAPGAPPRGFGSLVIGPLVADRVGGSADLELASEGAVWRAKLSARSLV